MAAAAEMLGRFYLPPIANRSDLAFYAEKYFHKLGNAVEVGVFEGHCHVGRVRPQTPTAPLQGAVAFPMT